MNPDMEEAQAPEPTSYLGDIAQWLTRTISLLVESEGRDQAEAEILAATEVVGEYVQVEDLESLSRAVRVLDGMLIPEVSQTEYVEDLYDTAIGLLIHAKHHGREDVLASLMESVESDNEFTVHAQDLDDPDAFDEAITRFMAPEVK